MGAAHASRDEHRRADPKSDEVLSYVVEHGWHTGASSSGHSRPVSMFLCVTGEIHVFARRSLITLLHGFGATVLC